MKCSWIEPDSLAVSSVPIHANDMRSLHQQGIRAVLSLTEYPLTRFRTITPALLDDLDMAAFHVPVPDRHPPTMAQAHEILRIIAAMHTQQRPLLIHCMAGIGRTGTVLHMHYIAQGMSLEAARAKVRVVRVQSTVMLTPQQLKFLHQFADEYTT